MPKLSRKSVDLMSVFADYSPQVMSNGQIRMECPFRENHPDGSGKMSFFATPNINGYKCFSCGCHGNLVRLLTTRFGVNYFEAMNSVNLTDYAPERKEFDLDVMWDFKNKKWVDGENLQLTLEGIIKTVKNNKITDNLESLPTFIL